MSFWHEQNLWLPSKLPVRWHWRNAAVASCPQDLGDTSRAVSSSYARYTQQIHTASHKGEITCILCRIKVGHDMEPTIEVGCKTRHAMKDLQQFV